MVLNKSDLSSQSDCNDAKDELVLVQLSEQFCENKDFP